MEQTVTNPHFPCPCCGFLTLSEEPPGTFEICPVCNWEDDYAQFHDPDLEGGANRISLNQARANFKKYRVSDKSLASQVRPPNPSEIPKK